MKTLFILVFSLMLTNLAMGTCKIKERNFHGRCVTDFEKEGTISYTNAYYQKVMKEYFTIRNLIKKATNDSVNVKKYNLVFKSYKKDCEKMIDNSIDNGYCLDYALFLHEIARAYTEEKTTVDLKDLVSGLVGGMFSSMFSSNKEIIADLLAEHERLLKINCEEIVNASACLDLAQYYTDTVQPKLAFKSLKNVKVSRDNKFLINVLQNLYNYGVSQNRKEDISSMKEYMWWTRH